VGRLSAKKSKIRSVFMYVEVVAHRAPLALGLAQAKTLFLRIGLRIPLDLFLSMLLYLERESMLLSAFSGEEVKESWVEVLSTESFLLGLLRMRTSFSRMAVYSFWAFLLLLFLGFSKSNELGRKDLEMVGRKGDCLPEKTEKGVTKVSSSSTKRSDLQFIVFPILYFGVNKIY